MAKPKADDWFQDEKLVILEGWARDGLTDEQIAENMGISAETLYRWKDKYCQALKKRKKAADRQVKNKPVNRAYIYRLQCGRKGKS